MFQIVYSKKALKFLKKQDIPTRKRIVAAIDRLPFDVNGIIIDIIDIGNRGQIYKGV